MIGFKKAICLEGGNFVNKGAEAMILTMSSSLKNQFPHLEISVRVNESDAPNAIKNHLRPYVPYPAFGIIGRFKNKISRLCFHLKHLAIIDVGGYYFGDPWGESRAAKRERQLKYCRWFNISIFFMPQAWGPFTSHRLAKITATVIRMAKCIYVRDRESLKAVQLLVGKEYDGLRIAHDIAWNFEGCNHSVGRNIIDDSGLNRDERSFLLCVTPNMRVYERYEGKGVENTYLKLFATVIRHVCKTYNARVILVGHEFHRENEVYSDDRVLCDYLVSMADLPEQVVHLDKVFSAAELKSIIGNCDLLLSSRYHALIAALSQEIPAVAFGWSHKYNEIMSDVGLKDNVITGMDATKICEKIDSLISRLEEMRHVLKSTVPKMKESGQGAVSDVITLLKDEIGG